MSGVKNFVSESELEEAKKSRQAEWERVRKPEDPIVAPDVNNQDNKCLYEKLKEQREKKQSELEEAQRLKHLVRGLDSEEVGFLDYVDEMKAAEEKQRRMEERELIQEIVKARETENLVDIAPVLSSSSVPSSSSPTAQIPSTSSKKTCAASPAAKPLSKQAQLISSSIVKRKSTESKPAANGSPDEKKKKILASLDKQGSIENDVVGHSHDDYSNSKKSSAATTTVGGSCSTMVEIGRRPSAMRSVGVLPGLLPVGGDDSDSSNNNNSSTDSSNDDDDQDSTTASSGKRKIVVEMKSAGRAQE